MTTESDGHALYYNDDLVTNLQLRWGEGFLSPGGATEIARMVRGIDLDNMIGLDFGCGIGGYDYLLVKNHGAGKVIGIDIDGAKIEVAKAGATGHGLDDKIEFLKVEPGPLSFEDNCSIPDDHIDPRRSAFFMARSVLRDIREYAQC